MLNLLYKFAVYVPMFLIVPWAARIAHEAIMDNQGQNCCAGSRTFVHEDIYDEFIAKAAELALNRKVGDPWLKNTENGPQVHFIYLFIYFIFLIFSCLLFTSEINTDRHTQEVRCFYIIAFVSM